MVADREQPDAELLVEQAQDGEIPGVVGPQGLLQQIRLRRVISPHDVGEAPDAVA